MQFSLILVVECGRYRSSDAKALKRRDLFECNKRVFGRIIVDKALLRANRSKVDDSRGTYIGLDRPARFAFSKHIGHAIAAEERGMIVDVHVKMRF